MLNVFKLELCRNIRKRYFFLIYLLLLGFCICGYLFIMPVKSVTFIDHFQTIQRLIVVPFVAFLFLGYEMFSDMQKRSWKELLFSVKNAIGKVLLIRITIMGVMVVIEFFVLLVIEICTWAYAQSAIPLMHILRVMILNNMLLPFLGAVIGMVLAIVFKKHWSGYLCIIIIVMCTCGILQKISSALYLTVGINLDPLVLMINLTQPNATWIADYVYLIPVEKHRFYLLIAWVLVCCAIVLFWTKSRAKRILMAVCMIGVVYCFGQVGAVKNFVNYEMNYASPTDKASEFKNVEGVSELKADFCIVDCMLKMQFEDELHADVTMVLDNPNLQQYHLTLYRGYELINIEDQNGASLVYERNGDYLLITPSEPLTQIHMEYKGYNQSLYSNRHGVMLPGYFAYYPQAGWRQVFWTAPIDGYYNKGFNTETDSLQATHYKIIVENYKQEVLSNLSGENNIFEGTTNSPTLISGAIEEISDAEYCIIRPSSFKNEEVISVDRLKQEISVVCDYFGIEDDGYQDVRTIIYVPSTLYIDNLWGRYAYMGDVLMLSTELVSTAEEEVALGVVFETLHVNGMKRNLIAIMNAVYRNAIYLEDLEIMTDREIQELKFDPEKETDEMIFMDGTFDRLYLTAIENYGAEQTAKLCMEYVLDANSDKNVVDFLVELCLKGEENAVKN